jgi:hypothetical protein
MRNAFGCAPQDENRPLANPARYRYPSEYSLSLLWKLGHVLTMLAEEWFEKQILDTGLKSGVEKTWNDWIFANGEAF